MAGKPKLHPQHRGGHHTPAGHEPPVRELREPRGKKIFDIAPPGKLPVAANSRGLIAGPKKISNDIAGITAPKEPPADPPKDPASETARPSKGKILSISPFGASGSAPLLSSKAKVTIQPAGTLHTEVGVTAHPAIATPATSPTETPASAAAGPPVLSQTETIELGELAVAEEIPVPPDDWPAAAGPAAPVSPAPQEPVKTPETEKAPPEAPAPKPASREDAFLADATKNLEDMAGSTAAPKLPQGTLIGMHEPPILWGRLLLLILLFLIVAVAIIDILLDLGILKPHTQIPHTTFFKK